MGLPVGRPDRPEANIDNYGVNYTNFENNYCRNCIDMHHELLAQVYGVELSLSSTDRERRFVRLHRHAYQRLSEEVGLHLTAG
jgi:hypothetical protein